MSGVVEGLASDGVRALIIATATHTGSRLPPVPAARRSAEALADRLVRVCGMASDRVRLLVDPPTSLDVARAVSEEAARATTALFVYYVGHGLRGPDGALYLAVSSTDELTPGLAAHQAYPFADLRQALTSARASSLVVVLDCCFSGRARAGAAPSGAFDAPPVHGFYLLGSAEQLALAPEDAEYTVFTGALIGLLDGGDPRGGPVLTLDDAYHYLFAALRDRGAPLPRRQEGGRSGQLVLARNPASTGPEHEEETEQSAGRSPYLSLAPFGEEDAPYFYGRAELSARLVRTVHERVDDPGPLLLVGASGSGKSSLVQAGLVPRIRQSPGWRCRLMRPGQHPLTRLAAGLDAPGTQDGEALGDPSLAVTWLPEDDPPVLLVVDQLEELVTVCQDEEERVAFAAALAALAGSGRAVVLGVLRADFYAQAMRYPVLADALQQRQFLIEPMDQAQLREAVEGPARVAGLKLDEALSDLLLHELGAYRRRGPESGALPLLSHALWATWQRRRGNRLTVRDYRDIGGIGGAIARTAEGTLASLDPPARAAARHMLPRLVRVNEEAADTALPVDRADLVRGLPADAADTALRALTDARLVIMERDVVRISHEALLSSWPTLAEWVEADRQWLTVAQRLTADARAWTAEGRDPSLLYRGARLALVLDQAAEAAGADELDQQSSAFLAAARSQERRSAQLRRGVVVALAVLLVVSLAGGLVAVVQGREASAQARVADARSLLTTADAVLSTDPRLALQLAVTAHRLSPGTASRALLTEVLATSRYAGGLPDQLTPVTAMALAPENQTLAVGTQEGVQLWDARDWQDPRPIGDPTGGFDVAVTAIAWHPSGRLLVAGDRSSLRFLSVSPDGPVVEVASLPGFGSTVETVAWSADGSVLVAGNATITVVITRHESGYRVAATLPHDPAIVSARAVLHQDGSSMVVGTDDGDAQLFDLSDPRSPRKVGPPLSVAALTSAPITAMALSADGSVLATGTADARVALWDLRNRERPRRVGDSRSVGGMTMQVVRVAFDRDDRALVVADRSGMVALMPFPPGTPLAERLNPGRMEPSFAAHAGQVGALAVDTSRGLLVTGGDDGTVRLWHLDDSGARPTRWGEPLAGHETDTRNGRIEVAANIATSTAEDGRLLVWDVTDDGAFTPRPPVRFAGSPGTSDHPSGSALSPDGGTVVTATADSLRLWDISPVGPPEQVGADVPLGTTPVDFAWSRDGQIVLSGGADGTVAVHDVADRAAPREITRFDVDGSVTDVHLAWTEPLAAIGTASGVVALWDLSDPEEPRRLGGVRTGQHGTQRWASALSADGTLLAIGQFSGTVQLWSVANPAAPEQLASWQTPGVGPIASAEFSPDGRVLAIGDTTAVRLWNIVDRQLPRRLSLPLYGQAILPVSLAFLPGGERLASQTGTHVDIWDLSALPTLRNQGVRLACDRLDGQGLSRADWARFLPGRDYQNVCA
ncbi:WD40 repeat protein [Micromonospora sp. Llam0]|uniref:caspase, EACC1-associated type n=1 Tax=Micromonospora sp. Llam0 TaxID=2485143 RepID=UPI000F4630DD|nr:caspase family protein [Micromonospora sp. Llam0]ROO63344.1 WD40 repeat protein [Micromonospora sp. Llam0]